MIGSNRYQFYDNVNKIGPIFAKICKKVLFNFLNPFLPYFGSLISIYKSVLHFCISFISYLSRITLISSSSFSSMSSSSISSLLVSFPSLLEFKLANSIDSLLTFKGLDFFFLDLTLVLALLLVLSSSNKSFSILSCLIFFFLPKIVI